MLTLKIFQPDSDKLQALYGDPRGCFEGLEQRRKWSPAQFDGEQLKMDFYSEVLSADMHGEDLSRIGRLYEEGSVLTALESLFRASNISPQMLVDLGYKGYSLSVGHVAAFVHDKHAVFYYCDNVGWEFIRPVLVPGMDEFDAYGLRKEVVV